MLSCCSRLRSCGSLEPGPTISMALAEQLSGSAKVVGTAVSEACEILAQHTDLKQGRQQQQRRQRRHILAAQPICASALRLRRCDNSQSRSADCGRALLLCPPCEQATQAQQRIRSQAHFLQAAMKGRGGPFRGAEHCTSSAAAPRGVDSRRSVRARRARWRGCVRARR